MTSIPRLSFSHMGIYAADLGRMEDFYTRVLGFAVTDRADLGDMLSFRLADLAAPREMARRRAFAERLRRASSYRLE